MKIHGLYMDEVYNIIKILIIHFPFSDKYLEIPAWSGFIVFLPGLQLAGQTSPVKKYKFKNIEK